MISPVNFPSWITKSVTFASKRTSPPRDLISSLIPATTFLKRSVPICGLFSYKISSGAPCSTKVSKTNLFLPNLSFTKVFSFPSENVPAPPSPNCTLDSEFSSPLSQKCSTSFIRFVTSFPLIFWKFKLLFFYCHDITILVLFEEFLFLTLT